MAATPRQRAPKDRRSEESIQRATVAHLRAMLPDGAVVHHSHQNIRARGDKARVQGGILKGLGVVAGFPDLTIIAERETPGPAIMFIELKAARGTLSPEQRAFRDLCAALGLPWALARSETDALAAVRAAGFRTRHHRRRGWG